MGYQRKDIQILGGGWNLLPPVDKTPITDYLLAQNWRVDQVGRLVLRFGYVQKGDLIPGPAYAHSAAVMGGVEGDYYIGATGATGGAYAGSVYRNFQTPAIASGFDGNRIAMVPMNGWLWIMNRSLQIKYSPAAGAQKYGLDAPGNACAAAAGADDAAGPSGTYRFYVTFATGDDSVESNPGPVSDPVTVAGQDIALSGIPVSSDPQVGKRNIYASGGTLGQAYLVATINDNATTTATWATSDKEVTYQGVAMPTTNDAPPAGAGMVGPYFARLIAWLGNRLYWTDPNTPQYWPGANDPQVGNWDDVGTDGEDIIWCTMHTNVLVIYKERSVWRLVGDPDTGTIERLHDGLGLASQWGAIEAGPVDYFVGPNGLYRCNLDSVQEFGAEVRPLFNMPGRNTGSLTAPGSVMPPAGYESSNALFAYRVALGYAMGKLYVGFSEDTTALQGSNPLLVYHETSGRWFYHRQSVGAFAGWRGFVFDGVQMVGLTGNGANGTWCYNLDDFRARYWQDPGGTPIECVYQSHYEDAGLPDNQKVWLEVVVDCELAGDTVNVYVGLDAGKRALSLVGTISGSGRVQKSFPLALDPASGLAVAKDPARTDQPDALAKNIAVAIQGQANHQVVLHNVYLYYYEEARLALAATTLPLDLGGGRVVQCKELALDIDASGGAVTGSVSSDLPGNQIAVRQQVAIAQTAGRGVLKFPFSVTEGYLWRVGLVAQGGAFRLYGAKLLARPIGVYVEAYEAMAGFVWDSMEMSFDSGITHIPRSYAIALASLPIKRAREISIEIDTFGGVVTVKLLSDLPGNAQATRFTTTVNTGAAGRRFVRLPLPAGTEGRIFRLQLSGACKFVLYGAAVEILAVGVYVEAYEAAGGAVYDSREVDFGTADVKECRELELDIETTGPVWVQLAGDLAATYYGSATTMGRQKVLLPLTVNAAAAQFLEGRLLHLSIGGPNAFRLYGARARVRPFGLYLTANEASAGALWDSTELDLGSQTVKQLRAVELDLAASGGCTVTVYTDLPGNAMAARVTRTLGPTWGRTKVQIPLPQGSVPDNYSFGRLVRVTVTSNSAIKLFGARIQVRPTGVYVESYEAAGGAVWDSTPTDLGQPGVKTLDQVRIEMDSDGAAAVTVYTDLPGEGFAARSSLILTSSAAGRHWATAPLPPGVEGRSVRLVVTSQSGFRIYRAQVLASRVGRYLAGATASGNVDALRTLEYDFRSERVKQAKWIEVDLRADQAVTLAVLTEAGQVYSTPLATPNGRMPMRVTLPQGISGRLVRVQITGGPARVYHVRVWMRPLNEPRAAWAWEDYPVEESDVLPQWADLAVAETPAQFGWADLPVPPTPAEWQWAPFPVNPTEAQWFWAKVLSVEETPEQFSWVDVPFEVAT